MFRTALAVTAALLLAACSKQPEDLTATYALTGGMGRITVKAARNGDARVDSGPQVFLRKDGGEYILLGDSQGQFAAKLDDFIATIGELMREGGMKPAGLPPQPEYELVKTGEETIAGEKGELWKVRPKATPSATSAEAVISTNPAYANVGKALAMQVKLGSAGVAQMQGGEGGIEKLAKEMLAKGMVLRFGEALKLEKIDKAPIEPTAIALPDKVLDRAGLKARLVAERDRARAAAAQQGGVSGRPPMAPPPVANAPALALPK